MIAELEDQDSTGDADALSKISALETELQEARRQLAEAGKARGAHAALAAHHALLDHAPQPAMSSILRARIRRIFEAADVDGNGRLDKDELSQLLNEDHALNARLGKQFEPSFAVCSCMHAQQLLETLLHATHS
jgi:hypothetical protein